MANRIVWVDSLKGLLILFVIMGHCIATTIGNNAANSDYWWCLIYSFHMPAFIAISGYLNYRSDRSNPMQVGKVVNRRFQQLMIPFLVWSVIKYAVEGDLLNCYNCILYPTNTFWFLWALFFIVALFSFFDWVAQKAMIKQEVIMGAACLGCAATMLVLKDIRIFGIQYVLYYFIFYCLGYYINKYCLFTNKVWALVLLLLAWFTMGSFWHPRELPEFIPFTGGLATTFRFVYKFSVALVGVFAIFSLVQLTMNKNGKIVKLISSIGSVSLGIYTFHLTFVNICVNQLRSCISSDTTLVFFSFVILSSLSYIATTLISKWRWSARIFLGKF